jgi:hypothetical protein
MTQTPFPAETWLRFCKQRFANNNPLRWWRWRWKMKRLARACGESDIEPGVDRCDVLVVHKPSKRGSRRNSKLIERLVADGISVQETTALSEEDISRQGLVCGPYLHDEVFRVYEGYANYLKRRYQPKVIVMENLTPLAPFLRSREPGDPVTFQLAHCVIAKRPRHNSMMDFDYYALYGPSSLQFLKALPLRFGDCNFLFAGSYLFDDAFQLPAPEANAPLLFLGMSPGLEARPEGERLNRLVADWQQQSGRELLVRVHPRARQGFWAQHKAPGIEVLPDESFVKSAGRASMVMSGYTTAVLDAALLKRPCQLLAMPGERDALDMERFFGQRVSTPEQLEAALKRHQENFPALVKCCDEFLAHHLWRGNQSVAYLSDQIQRLVAGEQLSPVARHDYAGAFHDLVEGEALPVTG